MTNQNNTHLENLGKIPEETWIYVIRHPNDFVWNFLAMKIILTRLNLKITMHQNSDAILRQCCEELRDLLRRSINIPNAQKDLQQILLLISYHI
ncbi:MAG: hypothetical protein LBL04_18315 [Bacteroidales bacterium]|nr:hypothetical protein [Bacteroidales bacterium]